MVSDISANSYIFGRCTPLLLVNRSPACSQLGEAAQRKARVQQKVGRGDEAMRPPQPVVERAQVLAVRYAQQLSAGAVASPRGGDACRRQSEHVGFCYAVLEVDVKLFSCKPAHPVQRRHSKRRHE
jgi:hypothetical protein